MIHNLFLVFMERKFHNRIDLFLLVAWREERTMKRSGGREDRLQTRSSVSTSEAGLHALRCSVTMSGTDNSMKEYDYEYIDLQMQEKNPDLDLSNQLPLLIQESHNNPSLLFKTITVQYKYTKNTR